VATARPAKDVAGTPSLAAALSSLGSRHDRSMGFISKPLAYSRAMPHGKREHANLIRLIKGGYVRVCEVATAPPHRRQTVSRVERLPTAIGTTCSMRVPAESRIDMGHSAKRRTSTSFASEAKWTPGSHPALFVDSTAGTWKAMVDTDEATWSVRGPDPDDEAHYASGGATNADVADGSTLDQKGRIAAAKRAARAYIMGQIAASGTKKTKAILEAEIAATRAEFNAGIAADAAARFVRPGDRFRYAGDVWRVTHVRRGPRGAVTMAREVPALDGRPGEVALVDNREFPRHALREDMTKI